MTITTLTLANELHVTQKTIRLAIKHGELRATRQRRGREQNVFVISREDADDWKRRRSAKAIGKIYPFNGETLQRPQHHHAYFPNRDNETMEVPMIEDSVVLQANALRGDEDAKVKLRMSGLKAWWRAGAGLSVRVWEQLSTAHTHV